MVKFGGEPISTTHQEIIEISYLVNSLTNLQMQKMDQLVIFCERQSLAIRVSMHELLHDRLIFMTIPTTEERLIADSFTTILIIMPMVSSSEL